MIITKQHSPPKEKEIVKVKVKKKKKKAKTTLPAVIEKEKPISKKALKNLKKLKRLKSRLKGLDSAFKEKVAEIQESLDNNQIPVIEIHKMALAMLVELIPIAEDKYRQYGNERSAYALNTIVSQLREIMADVRAEQDSSEIIINRVLQIQKQRFQLIGQNIFDTLYHLLHNIGIYIPAEYKKSVQANIKESATSIATYLEQIYKSMVEDLDTEFRGKKSGK